MKIFLLAVVPCFQLVERMVRGGEGTQEDEQLLKEAALNVSPNWRFKKTKKTVNHWQRAMWGSELSLHLINYI